MSLRTGLAATLTSPVAEGTYGVAPSLSAAKFSAFKTVGMELKKGVQQGQGILAGKLYPVAARRVFTEWDVTGSITMDIPQRGLQQWLFPMFGSYGQTASALTQDGVTGAYKAIHTGGALEGNSFCLQAGVPSVDNGTVEPFTYVGCKIADWEIPTVQKGQIATLNITVDARNELAGGGNTDPLNVSVPTLQAYTAPASGGVFHFRQASVYTGGTPSTTSGVTSVSGPTLAANVRSFSLKHSVPMDTQRYNVGNSGFKAEQLQNALRQVTGQLQIEWLSAEAYYSQFAADTSTALELQFIGAGIGSGSDFSTLSFLMADVFLDSAPVKVEGPGPVLQTASFVALDNGADNILQATYWTLDSA